MANAAKAIELKVLTTITDDDREAHLGYVVSAVIQSAAAVESEVAEIFAHGPDRQLHSSLQNGVVNATLRSIAPKYERNTSALQKYDIVLKTMSQPAMNSTARSWIDALLLMELRNEIVHYKSVWSHVSTPAALTRSALLTRLIPVVQPPPPFTIGAPDFFPHTYLSAQCAKWACKTSAALIDSFYLHVKIPSPLVGYAGRIL